MTKTLGEIEVKVDRITMEIGHMEQQMSTLLGGSANLEIRIAVLEAKILGEDGLGEDDDGDVRVRLRNLEVAIHGEPELYAQWQQNKRLGITPNIPEPAIGMALVFQNLLDGLNRRVMEVQSAVSDSVSSLMIDVSKRLTFTRGLEAFFGPMLQDKNPPLDGNQVADKSYVDEGLTRLASAIRDEMNPARSHANAFRLEFDQTSQPAIHGFASIATQLKWVIDRERSREAAERTAAERDGYRRDIPARIRSVVRALLGEPPQAGAR